MRFFNITTIDAQGAATLTQVWFDNFASAMALVVERAARISKHQLPLIRAFIYDTQTRELREYRIDDRRVHQVELRLNCSKSAV